MEIIGRKCDTDKITHHEYHKIYDLYLRDFYQSEGAMIEIGVSEKHSINLWLELFPNAFIYGADIKFSESGDRYQIYQIDQSQQRPLEFFKSKINKKIFFINDDGSHVPEHQILTFNILFPLLEDGGIYIIEDIETSYWTKGSVYDYPTRYGYKHPKSIIEIFKKCIDNINSEFMLHPSEESGVMHCDMIHSIIFSKNCIIIKKGGWGKREYRFKRFL